MKFLWLAPYPMQPVDSGGRIRLAALIGHQLAQGHEVELWCMDTNPGTMPGELPPNLSFRFFKARHRDTFMERMRTYPAALPEVAWARRTQEAVAAVEALDPAAADVAVLCQAHCGWAAAGLARRGIPVVLDAHNTEWELVRQIGRHASRATTRVRLAIDSRKYRAFERRLLGTVAATVAVSADDAERLRRLAPGAAISVHPNGVDTAHFTPAGRADVAGLTGAADGAVAGQRAAAAGRRLVMTANLGFAPNVDACNWLAAEILPALRRRDPRFSLRLVGSHAIGPTRALHDPAAGIEVIESVPDVRPYLRQADVFVAPLRLGSGTRLKVLEAMAAGIPVVATTLAIEGLGVEDVVLRADTTEAFVDAVTRAVEDPGASAGRAARAREVAVARFDWRTIAAAFQETVEGVVAR